MKDDGPRLTVGELAEIAGVTVRTLHFYDQKDLLSPKARSPAGYRLYDRDDLLTLQEILFYRELGIPLGEIQELLLAKDTDRRMRLLSYQKTLGERIKTLLRIQNRLEEALRISPEDLKEVKVMKDLAPLYEGFTKEEVIGIQQEAKELYGGELYDIAAKRTQSWSEKEWEEVKGEAQGIYQRLAESIESAIDSPEIVGLVGEYFKHMQRYYPSSPEVFRGLADLYDNDQRFQRTFRRHHPDLGPKLSEAMRWAVDHGLLPSL
jgi:DNA-binding transcriptional MerR regulator